MTKKYDISGLSDHCYGCFISLKEIDAQYAVTEYQKDCLDDVDSIYVSKDEDFCKIWYCQKCYRHSIKNLKSENIKPIMLIID